MKNSMRLAMLVSALLVSAACKGGEGGGSTGATPAAAAGGGDCGAIGTKVAKLMSEQMGKELPKEKASKLAPIVDEMAKAMAASCKEDGWPADAVKCMASANDEAAMDKCGDSLDNNAELKKKMENRLKPVMTKAMGIMMEAAAADAGAAGMAPAAGAPATGAAPAAAPTTGGAAPAAAPTTGVGAPAAAPATGTAPAAAPAPAGH